MRRLAAALLLLFAVACNGNGNSNGNGTVATEEPSPPLEIPAGALSQAALAPSDLGSGWAAEKDAVPSTLQIGGKVGPANVKGAEQEVTTAFKKDNSSAYVTNSLFLVESAAVAEAVLLAHRQATEEKWTQERKDGGGADFRRVGEVPDLPSLGDEMFSVKVNTTIRDASGAETKRQIEYVVYRIDRLLAFVIAQDVGVSNSVRRQEQKVARLVP